MPCRQTFLCFHRGYDGAESVQEDLDVDTFPGTSFEQVGDAERIVIVIEDIHAQAYRVLCAGYGIDESRKEILAVDQVAHTAPRPLPARQTIEFPLPGLEIHTGSRVERGYRRRIDGRRRLKAQRLADGIRRHEQQPDG